MPLYNPPYNILVGARANQSSGQSLASGSAVTVNFDTVVYDPQSSITTGSGWTFTARIAGTYLVTSATRFASGSFTSGNDFNFQVNKNGSLFAYLDLHHLTVSGTYSPSSVKGSTSVVLAVGDTVNIQLTHAEGSNRSLSANAAVNYVDVVLIGR